jgi:hypothetical protein
MRSKIIIVVIVFLALVATIVLARNHQRYGDDNNVLDERRLRLRHLEDLFAAKSTNIHLSLDFGRGINSTYFSRSDQITEESQTELFICHVTFVTVRTPCLCEVVSE